MRRITGIAFILFVLSLTAFGGDNQVRRPFFDARSRQTYYAGPGRENRPAGDVKEVAIGYFGPSTPSHPEAGDMWNAACLAIEEANQAGGYKGLPLRLVAGWAENPWGSGVTQVTRMVYVHNVWAIIGGIDGPSTHLAEQVVVKARLTLLSPVSSDRTANLANVPWMFSCLPQDHLQAPVLAEAIASLRLGSEPVLSFPKGQASVGARAFILVSAVDHDSHLFTVELIRHLVELRLSPFYHYEFDPRQGNVTELAQHIADTRAEVLVLVAGGEASAHLIRAVREKGFAGRVFGGPCMGRRSFIEEAGKAADGAVFPLLYAGSAASKSFEDKFVCRFGKQPDYLAAHTYDGVNLLIAAIRKAGLNRVCICDALRELSPWQGVTGSIKWDPLGSNCRRVALGTIRNGCVLPVSQK
jgi:branched-chain amino acid transport system substrate-binding protein